MQVPVLSVLWRSHFQLLTFRFSSLICIKPEVEEDEGRCVGSLKWLDLPSHITSYHGSELSQYHLLNYRRSWEGLAMCQGGIQQTLLQNTWWAKRCAKCSRFEWYAHVTWSSSHLWGSQLMYKWQNWDWNQLMHLRTHPSPPSSLLHSKLQSHPHPRNLVGGCSEHSLLPLSTKVLKEWSQPPQSVFGVCVGGTVQVPYVRFFSNWRNMLNET